MDLVIMTSMNYEKIGPHHQKFPCRRHLLNASPPPQPSYPSVSKKIQRYPSLQRTPRIRRMWKWMFATGLALVWHIEESTCIVKYNVVKCLCSPTQSIQALEKVQREIEEKNKKKKEIVERTLKERYLRSRQESDHLKMVRNELATLDKLVTRDIEIMRKKIEESNVLYSQARLAIQRAPLHTAELLY